MIELELELSASQSMYAANFSRSKIDIFHVGFDYVDVTQNPPERIHDVDRRKIASGDFVQHRREENEILPRAQSPLDVPSLKIASGAFVHHRREENEILPRDQRHFDVPPPRQMLVEIFRGVEAC